MATKPLDQLSARDRLLAAADELFYEEGVHIVGIDRVIERAGVAKATLYNAFGSKDELIREYLERRHVARKERMMRRLERFVTPRDRLVGIFDIQAELVAEPGYRGCAFLNASAETPAGGAVQEVSDESRGWMRGLMTSLAEQAGVSDPAALTQKLVLLYDGAVVAAQMDRNPRASLAARDIAAMLIDDAIG